MKTCCRCKLDKEDSDFSPNNNRCRKCSKEYQAERRAQLALTNREIDLSGTKQCSTCKLDKLKTDFGLAKGLVDGLQSQCNVCRAVSRKAYNTSVKGHTQNMLSAARRRAKTSEKGFELASKDIEDLWVAQGGKCAVTGIALELENTTEEHNNSRNPFGPSIDRVAASKGYTVDNIRLVVTIANVAMNNWGESVMEPVLVALLRQQGYNVLPPVQITTIAPATPTTVN